MNYLNVGGVGGWKDVTCSVIKQGIKITSQMQSPYHKCVNLCFIFIIGDEQAAILAKDGNQVIDGQITYPIGRKAGCWANQ